MYYCWLYQPNLKIILHHDETIWVKLLAATKRDDTAAYFIVCILVKLCSVYQKNILLDLPKIF